MMIADAIQDLKNAALSGKELNYAEVAEDYGINPALLERKFKESYPHGVIALESETDMLKKRIAENVEHYCKMYGVDQSFTKEMTIRGVKYTVICRISGAKRFKYAAVSHKDGLGYRIAA